jgi:polar amino acid transport system substrate-binding protein
MPIQQTRRGALTLVAASLVLLASSAFTAQAETTLERIKQTGAVRIGFANEAPFGYATAEGSLTGEAPEIAKIILAQMGITEVDAVLMPFRSLIPGLQAGRVDIVAAGMFVTPQRCGQVAFSEPTFSVGQSMIVAKGNPKNIHSYSDFLKDESLRLGVVGGGQAHKYAQAVGIANDQISVYPDGPSGRAAIEADRIDAWAMTSLAVQRLLDSAGDGSVERALPFEDPIIEGKAARGHGAFAFRQADADFRDEFNQRLKAFIGTAEHKKLVRQFGFTDAEAPVKATRELCAAK